MPNSILIGATGIWQLATGDWRLATDARQKYRRRSTRPAFFSRGANRSPVFLKRARTLSRRKSSMRTPLSISFHDTGVETQASGCGRTEYTEASVRPHAFWL